MSGFSRRQGPMAWLWSLAAAALGLLLGLGLLLWLEPSQPLSGFRGFPARIQTSGRRISEGANRMKYRLIPPAMIQSR